MDCTFWKTLHKKGPYSEFFWSVFLATGLNNGRYGISPRIQSECGKIQTRKTPNTNMFDEARVIGFFSRSSHYPAKLFSTPKFCVKNYATHFQNTLFKKIQLDLCIEFATGTLRGKSHRFFKFVTVQ